MNSNSSDLWSTFSTVNEWVRFSDSKAAALLVVNGVLAGLGIPAIVNSYDLMQDDLLLVLITIVGVLALVVSSGFCLKCLNPSLRSPQSSSLIYFTDIAEHFPSSDAYVQRLTETLARPNWQEEEIGAQIWSNSVVARRKYFDIAWATRAFAVALLMAVAFAIKTA